MLLLWKVTIVTWNLFPYLSFLCPSNKYLISLYHILDSSITKINSWFLHPYKLICYYLFFICFIFCFVHIYICNSSFSPVIWNFHCPLTFLIFNSILSSITSHISNSFIKNECHHPQNVFLQLKLTPSTHSFNNMCCLPGSTNYKLSLS